MHNIKKCSNILKKSCGVLAYKNLKCVWPIFTFMNARVKLVVTTSDVLKFDKNINFCLQKKKVESSTW